MAKTFTVPLAGIIKETMLETIYMPAPPEEILVYSSDVNRPGLALSGYFDYFDNDRVQVMGKSEFGFLEDLAPETRALRLDELASHKPPAMVVSRGLEIFPELKASCEKYQVPLLRTADTTSGFMASLIAYLNVQLAPRITRHGVFVEVYGEGILLMGDSGVGKSETAIELVKRGHRLIADDAVEIKKVSSRELMGAAPEVLRHYIEIRGIGVINVAKLFGMGAVKDLTSIDLIVNMVPWRDGEAYDRLGMETQYTEILGVKVPSVTIPITPGRNLAVILEVAAMNNRQKRMGYNAAVEFTEQMSRFFENKNQ